MKLIAVGLFIAGFGVVLSMLQPPTIVGPILLAVGFCCILVAVFG